MTDSQTDKQTHRKNMSPDPDGGGDIIIFNYTLLSGGLCMLASTST